MELNARLEQPVAALEQPGIAHVHPPPSREQPNSSRVQWIDYLRSCSTILVVAGHSALAYAVWSQFNKSVYVESSTPVVDNVRWIGLDLCIEFFEIFLMPLMFLIAGIFITHRIHKKGARLFVRDRFIRLFIPFVLGQTILVVLTFYPSYILARGRYDLKGFLIDLFQVEGLPKGPPWFVWVLLCFTAVFSACYPYIKRRVAQAGGWLERQKQRPARILLYGYIITWILYVPMVFTIDPMTWLRFGPFAFQPVRLLSYFGYFLIGIVIGVPGLDKGIFAEGTGVTKKWLLWLISSLGIFVIFKLGEPTLDRMIAEHRISMVSSALIYRSVYNLSCVISCIAFITLFRKIFRGPSDWWRSFSANAYGVYLFHYVFASWCQYFLLSVNLPAIVKFLLTTVCAVYMSWGLTHLLRKIKIIGKYL